MNPPLSVQIFSLARRSVVRTLRQPAMVIPALVFPLLFFGIQSGGLGAAAQIPGFPADAYRDFVFTFPLMQGALFGATSAGADFARDIEGGFFNRLSLTPMRPVALLAGLLSGVVALGLIQGSVFVIAGLIWGVSIKSGFLGGLVLILFTSLVALGFGGIGAILALRTGSGEAVQSFFPLFFAAIFFSSINLPRDLIEADWFRIVATVNPISYLIEGIRSLIITGWDIQALTIGFGCAFAIVALGLAGAAASLRTRMERT